MRRRYAVPTANGCEMPPESRDIGTLTDASAPHRPPSCCVRRFLAYGVLGLGVEVVFTSISRALRTRDARLAGRTYLWMLPIYGAGGLVLERLHARLVRRGVPAPVRALAGTFAIFAWEYATGSALRRALGECPWRYRRGLTLGGYVRLDYLPYWYGAALLFESLQHEVRKLDRARRGLERRTSPGATGRGASADAAGAPPTPERRRGPRRAADRTPSPRAGRRRDRDARCAAEPAAPVAIASA